MSARPTPETDAHMRTRLIGPHIDFVRNLERERDEAREELVHFKQKTKELAKDYLREGREKDQLITELRQKLSLFKS